MARYSDTIRDERTLAPVCGAEVYVRNQDGGTATIYDDDDGSVISYARSDEYGNYAFNAPAKYYDLTIQYRGRIIAEEFGVAVGIPVIQSGDTFDDGLWTAPSPITDDGAWG